MSKVIHFEETNTFEVSLLVLLKKQIRFFHWFIIVDHNKAVALRFPKGWSWAGGGPGRSNTSFLSNHSPWEKQHWWPLFHFSTKEILFQGTFKQYIKVDQFVWVYYVLWFIYYIHRGERGMTVDVFDFIMCLFKLSVKTQTHITNTKEWHLSCSMIHLLPWAYSAQKLSYSCRCHALFYVLCLCGKIKAEVGCS